MVKKLGLSASAFATVVASGVALSSATTEAPPEGVGKIQVYYPIQSIAYDLGSKLAVGYFAREQGRCVVTMMVTDAVDRGSAVSPSATGVRVNLMPGQGTSVDGEKGRAIALTCGSDADTLIVHDGTLLRVAPKSDLHPSPRSGDRFGSRARAAGPREPVSQVACTISTCSL